MTTNLPLLFLIYHVETTLTDVLWNYRNRKEMDSSILQKNELELPGRAQVWREPSFLVALTKFCACEAHGFERMLQARQHLLGQSVKQKYSKYFKMHYIPGKSRALKPHINHCRLRLLFPQKFFLMFLVPHTGPCSASCCHGVFLSWQFTSLSRHVANSNETEGSEKPFR